MKQTLEKKYLDILQVIHQTKSLGIGYGLDRILKILHWIDNPQLKFFSIHLVGTNGKGSTAAMIEKILRDQGFQTGLITSPHLHSYRERIQINGSSLSKRDFVYHYQKLEPFLKKVPLTYFEIGIVLALMAFAKRGIDFLIAEAGLGGRLDATNVLPAKIVVLTSIGLDHQEYLGSTKKKILKEKLGVIKKNQILWTAQLEPSLMETLKVVAAKKKAPFFIANSRWQNLFKKKYAIDFKNLALKGSHQMNNATLALGVIHSLIKQGVIIKTNQVNSSLKKTFWPARLETIKKRPLILIDAAHNLAGIKVLADFLKLKNLFDLELCFGALNNRPYKKMLLQLLPFVKTVSLVHFNHNNAVSLKEWKKMRPEIQKNVTINFLTENQLKDRIFSEGTKKNSQKKILVAGSLFFVASLRAFIKGVIHEENDEFV